MKANSARHGFVRLLALAATALFVGISLYASNTPTPVPEFERAKAEVTATPTERAVAAADAFLKALEPPQREKAVHMFASDKKSGWSNLPVTIVPRNGVRLGDLTKVQRTLAMDAVAAVLSKIGYQKVVDIMDGDQQLVTTGGKGGKGGKGKGEKGKGGKGKGGAGPGQVMFGADQYYLAIFGKPSTTEPWMVHFGGHHLGLNVTVIGKHFILTPTHTGAQPTLFKRDGKDVRPLGVENDTAFTLVNALDEKQRTTAILGDRPQAELLLGPGRDGRKIEPQGIKGAALTAEQKKMLLDVIAAWVSIVESDAAEERMAEIKNKIDDTYFAWKGPTARGSAVYFRVQGPSIVIEYAPQGSTDHIHTVVRNPNNDYGAALLKQ